MLTETFPSPTETYPLPLPIPLAYLTETIRFFYRLLFHLLYRDLLVNYRGLPASFTEHVQYFPLSTSFTETSSLTTETFPLPTKTYITETFPLLLPITFNTSHLLSIPLRLHPSRYLPRPSRLHCLVTLTLKIT